MAEQNQQDKNPMEPLQKGAEAVGKIQGAIKTGKAIAGIAKGAATGGPYGAVLMGLWSNRKHVLIVVVSLLVLLLLPILFILMLPTIIFGGLNATPETPVLNDDTAIVENVNNLSFTISGILGEGLDDVITRIERDFSASGADQMEIINPYTAAPIYNINLFLSQYCAAKNEDYQSINAADLERILRDGKSHLYSFTSREETRTSTSTDPETGEETTTSEVWIIYTIIYNGEAYFEDTIFKLSEEQKTLANDYAYNLSLYLGDGLFQGLIDGEFTPGPSYEGVIFTDGSTPVVYFSQLDERFADEAYGTDKIGTHGCGPTAMSIVVSTMTDQTMDPIQMSEWAYKKGYWCKNSGSYHSLIPGAAEAWDLPVEGCTASEPQRIVDALSSGKLVVAIMTKGHFTSSGHFIVLRGVTADGKIMVADPASYKRSQQTWDLSIILNEASKRAGAGGPFWIIG